MNRITMHTLMAGKGINFLVDGISGQPYNEPITSVVL